jgi:rhizosphere induced protein
MISNVPIGGVCLYFGEVAWISSAHNPAWPPPAAPAPAASGDDEANGVKALLEVQHWMVCDGRELSVSAFPYLYAVLGNLYGGDVTSGVFRLPDLRGVFIRGVDHGAGADPDIDQRMFPNGSGHYDGVGSMQLDAMQTHQHNYNEPSGSTVSDKGTPAYSVAPVPTPTSAPNPPARISANETRARNIAAYYIIRCA